MPRWQSGAALVPHDSAPDEAPGLPVLLRGWRARADAPLGKPLTQAEVALRVGMSERWYRDLERGAVLRLDPRVLGLLADTLGLDADERATLYFYALGGNPYATSPRPEDADGRSALQGLVNFQMPRPAYLADSSWNIAGYNQAMAEWFPWVREPGASVLEWALTTGEAREQLIDWPWHARMYLAMIRYAMAQHPDDSRLAALLDRVLLDPACQELWRGRTCVVASRDGHRARLRLPHVAPAVFDVVSQVLIPARSQNLRLVTIT
ncbi:helix-turn-helix transcriptional regulator [Actinacidiphila sp. ITFR-21]|uniref:helix-turn-helix transcriptional regulator n=1 Tax=Actinacidiphila sp. ITFR-21 TaxID=3075199 RepID=UPI00288AAB69|nr:helix-turn-helix domain-containing protein [Streptomyces sp. ITFR-21]WNI18780.1 helix-turn-helix domain-containing protein [Streptomyces sp. ITFR-21]